ncbi:UNVERIFIED_CONTAM: hypothetical protein FKN15_070196 [Acipenser sinensis]
MSLLNEKKKRSSFYECVVNEDDSADIFQVLLSHSSVDMNLEGDLGNTPVMLASSIDNHEALNLLASLNVKDNKGNTPLHLAVKNKQSESCRTLLELGADPNILNANLMSPLHMAINLRHNEIVEVLLSHSSVDMNLEGDLGNTPVMLACSIDNHEALNLLAREEMGYQIECHINYVDKSGSSPLHLAVHGGNIEVIQLCIANGAKIDLQQLTRGARLCEQNKLGHFAIHSAAFSGSKKSMEIILKKGEEMGYQIERHINCVDKSGSSPLHLAVHGGNIEVIQLCIANGAKIDLQQGANIDSLDCESHSPLLLATTCGAWRTVELLVRKGANVKLKDSCGCNFLHLAVQQPKGLKNISEKILQLKDVKELLNDEDNEGCIPLHYACRLGIQESVTNMLGLKNTALHLAARVGHASSVSLLLSKGAEISLNKSEATFFHEAIHQGRNEVAFVVIESERCHEAITTYKLGSTKIVPVLEMIEFLPESFKLLLDRSLKESEDDVNSQDYRIEYNFRYLQCPLTYTKLSKEDTVFKYQPLASLNAMVKFNRVELLTHPVSKKYLEMKWFERFGIYVVMFGEILQTLFCIILLFFFLNLAFALAFYALMLEQIGLAVGDIAEVQRNACLKRIAMQIDLHTNLEEKLPYWLIKREDQVKVTVYPNRACGSKIGLAVGDIAEVQRNACLKRIAMQIDLHTNLEEKLPYWLIKREDQVKVTVYPNRACGSKVNERIRSSNSRMPRRLPSGLAYGLKAHVLNLAIYSLGLVPLTILIVNLRPEISVNRTAENGTEVRGVTMTTQALDKHNSFYTVCMILVLVMTLYAVGKEMVQLYRQRWRYLLDYSNYFDWCIAVESLLFVIPLLYNSQEHWSWQCGAIAVFHSWINFLLYMQRFERFGIYVVMFGEILQTLFCIILLFFFLNLAFALAFYALMLEQIGLAVGDIAEVQRNACLKRIAMQIDLHTNLEEKLPYWFIKREDQVKVTVYPNRACGSKQRREPAPPGAEELELPLPPPPPGAEELELPLPPPPPGAEELELPLPPPPPGAEELELPLPPPPPGAEELELPLPPPPPGAEELELPLLPVPPRQGVRWPEPQKGELPATKKGEVRRPSPNAALSLPEVLWPEPHRRELPAMKKGEVGGPPAPAAFSLQEWTSMLSAVPLPAGGLTAVPAMGPLKPPVPARDFVLDFWDFKGGGGH